MRPLTLSHPHTLFLLALFFSSSFAQSLSDAGLDFERTGGAWPMNWQKWAKGYSLSIDGETKYAGKYSVKLSADSGRGEGSFGCAVTPLKNSFTGSVIELRGYLKLDGVSGGKAGLFMRTDAAAGMVGIVDVNDKGTEGTSDWRPFSVSLPLKGVERIWVGALTSGSGTLWADDLEVFVDGRPAAEMMKAFPADQDHQFDKGSGITALNVSPDTLNNLVLLGKVWGFLKYYHPAVAEGKHNWDYELFRMLPQYLKARTKNARNAFLAAWIDSLGVPPKAPLASTIDSARAKMFPDLRWIKNTSELGKTLSAKLVRIRSASRPLEQYYVAQFPGVGHPDFRNERAYEEPSYPDAGFRLLAVYRYWNMIQYFFPYRYLIKDWNAMLQVYLPRFLRAANNVEYRLAAMELVGRVEDSHANIWRDKTLDEYRGKLAPPCEVMFLEGRPVVVRTAENDSIRCDLKVGDVIETVNGSQVRGTFMMKLQLLSAASNHEGRLRDIARLMLRTNDSLTVGIERNGKQMTVQVRCYEGWQQALGAKMREREMWKRLGDIGYIFPGSIRNDSIPSIMKSLADTKGLIIDLRCYPAEFMVFTLGEHLMPRPTKFAKFSTGSIVQPGLFQFTEPISVGRDNPDHYKGKVVILVNEISISQSEYTAMAYRAAPGAIVIGSTTAGADGNVSPIVLPGGIRTLISGIGVYYPDGRETQKVGIVPDIVVRPTIKGVREGRDEVLERAVEVIGKE